MDLYPETAARAGKLKNGRDGSRDSGFGTWDLGLGS